LINGKLAAKDASDAWKRKSKELLGVSPETDKDGVLQMFTGHMAQLAISHPTPWEIYTERKFLHAMKKTLDVDGLLAEGKLNP